MIQVPIKPLSINQAYRGRRFSTTEKLKFAMHCNVMIPAGTVPEGQLRVDFEFGFSNKGQDIDGPIKVCLDILQEKYKFNDNRVYEMSVTKKIVKKGEEYWAFKITEA